MLAFKSLVKGLHELSCSGNKVMIKVHHAQKLLKGLRGSLSQGPPLTAVAPPDQLALGRIDNQAVLVEPLKESSEVRHMFRPGGTGDDNVS